MTYIDLLFSIQTQSPIPTDHGYALYGAISRVLPEVHRENGITIHPIRGSQIGNRQLALNDSSRVTLRVPDGQIAPLLALAGKQLRIVDATVRVGVPNVQALVPATALRSRLVVIKVAHTPAKELTVDNFLAAARKQLDNLGISPEVQLTIPPRPTGPHQGEPMRRALRIKDRKIIGYELLLEGLTAEESITVQEKGLGGRHHMGCGVFVPFGKEGDDGSK